MAGGGRRICWNGCPWSVMAGTFAEILIEREGSAEISTKDEKGFLRDRLRYQTCSDTMLGCKEDEKEKQND